MRRAVVPANAKPFTQFQAHAWIRLNITHVPCFDAVFRHDPELIADEPIAHWSTARFARLAPNGFQKRIARRHNADSKQKFDRRIEEIFLQQMNNPMFHLLVLTRAFLQTVRLSSRNLHPLALTLVGVSLFPAKEAHSFVIINVLRTIDDGNHFLLGTNGLTGTGVLDNFFKVALRRIPITPDLDPNLVVGHTTPLRKKLSLTSQRRRQLQAKFLETWRMESGEQKLSRPASYLKAAYACTCLRRCLFPVEPK